MNYQFGPFLVDTVNFTLQEEGNVISVEPQVFNLIVYLIENRHRLVSRQEIFDTVWAGRAVCDTSLSNHIKSARKVLGDDGQKQCVIKTTHGRGYQFIASTEALKQPEQPNLFADKKYHNSKKIVFQCALGLIFIAVLFVFFDPSKDKSLKKIAVLPLVNLVPDPHSDHFGFVIADQIIGDFSYLKNIVVRPSSSIKKYATQNYDVLKVGQSLNVEYVLSGNYLVEGDTIRVNLELIDIKSNELLWRLNQFEVNFSQAFKLQDIVTDKLVEGLKIELSEQEFNRIHRDSATSPLAYEYYFRAISYPNTAEGNRLAVEMLKKSINIDDRFAPAYANLGKRIRNLEQFDLVDIKDIKTAESYYLKALSLNPELLSALSYLSFFYTENNQIEKAVVLARKMKKINHNSPTAHFTLGYIYRYAGMVKQAINEMETAVSMDKKNPRFRSLIGSYSGLNEYQKALDMTSFYSESPFTLGWRGLMSLHLGNKEQALDYFDKVIEADPQGLWRQVAIVHKAYIQNNFEKGLIAAKILEQTKVSDGETIYYNAAYFCILEDKNHCLTLLKKAVDNGYFNYIFIENSSYFETVRQDKEYISIIDEAKRKHQVFKNEFF